MNSKELNKLNDTQNGYECTQCGNEHYKAVEVQFDCLMPEDSRVFEVTCLGCLHKDYVELEPEDV